MAVKKKVVGGTKGNAQKVIGAKRGSKIGIVAAVYVLKAAARRRVSKPVAETIEQRLEGKAALADTKIFASRSLGQMSREERRKLLFG